MRKESSKTRIAHNRDYTELLSRRIRASPIIELSSLETLIKRRRLNKQLATLVSLNVPPFSINATGIYHRRKKKKKKQLIIRPCVDRVTRNHPLRPLETSPSLDLPSTRTNFVAMAIITLRAISSFLFLRSIGVSCSVE